MSFLGACCRKYILRIFLFALLVCSVLVEIACNSKLPDKKNRHNEILPGAGKTSMDCVTGRDTVFYNGDDLRFVSVGDTAIDVKVHIKGKAALLGFEFNCGVPSGLIPQVLKHSEHQMVLVRGYGFHYREVVLCSFRAGAIQMQRFETELTTGAKYDGVVYPDFQDTSKLVLTDLRSKKDMVIKVEAKVPAIKRFQINETSLVVVGSRGEVVTIPLKR